MNTITTTTLNTLIALTKGFLYVLALLETELDLIERNILEADPAKDRDKAVGKAMDLLRETSLDLWMFYSPAKKMRASLDQREIRPFSRPVVKTTIAPPPPPPPVKGFTPLGVGSPDSLYHHRTPHGVFPTDPPQIHKRLPKGGKRVAKGGIFDPKKFKDPIGSGHGIPSVPKTGRITTPPAIPAPELTYTSSRKKARDHKSIWATTSPRSRASFNPPDPAPKPDFSISPDPEWEAYLDSL